MYISLPESVALHGETQKTLGKDSFAESLFAECRLPSVTLGKAFVECFLGFTVCTGHTAKLLIPVVPSYFLKGSRGRKLLYARTGIKQVGNTITAQELELA